MRLKKDFFLRNADVTAKDLLGNIFVLKKSNEVYRFRITETEAYCGIYDKASHSYGGKITERNSTMYKKGGTVYVYMIYGMYFCLNVVCREEGEPQAVLIRGAEPLDHKEEILFNSGKKNICKTTNGPGKICRIYGIDKSFNGIDLTENKFFYIEKGNKNFDVLCDKRINIDYSEEYRYKEWRFLISGSNFVSKKVSGM